MWGCLLLWADLIVVVGFGFVVWWFCVDGFGFVYVVVGCFISGLLEVCVVCLTAIVIWVILWDDFVSVDVVLMSLIWVLCLVFGVGMV